MKVAQFDFVTFCCCYLEITKESFYSICVYICRSSYLLWAIHTSVYKIALHIVRYTCSFICCFCQSNVWFNYSNVHVWHLFYSYNKIAHFYLNLADYYELRKNDMQILLTFCTCMQCRSQGVTVHLFTIHVCIIIVVFLIILKNNFSIKY